MRRCLLVAEAFGAGNNTGQKRSANLLVEDTGLEGVSHAGEHFTKRAGVRVLPVDRAETALLRS